MSIAQVQTLMGEVATAIGASDFATALNRALQAQALMAALSDGSAGGHQVTLAREQVRDVIAQCKAALGSASSSSGLGSINVTYTRPASTG